MSAVLDAVFCCAKIEVMDMDIKSTEDIGGERDDMAVTRAARTGGTFLAVVLTSVATAALTSFVFLAFSETDTPADTLSADIPHQETADEQAPSASYEEAITAVVEAAAPSVVSVVATQDLPVIEQYYVDPFGDEFFGGPSPFRIPQYRQNGTEPREVAAGTGFVVSADGLIMTNRHVVDIEGETEFTAVFGAGEQVAAEVVAIDPVEDIALLRVERDNLSALPLGDSDHIQIGSTAIAIGNALGEFQNTVSVGVVSGLGRRVVAGGGASQSVIDGAIQTDAAINQGNSGGPLLNSSGEVIGINTAIVVGSENLGFAIPVNKAKKALSDVQEFGHISRPFIGVRFVTVDAEIQEARGLPNSYGALIIGSADGREPGVLPGSPADTAGLREGDIILEVDGVKINADNQLGSVVNQYSVGDEVALLVYSQGQTREITLTLAEREE